MDSQQRNTPAKSFSWNIMLLCGVFIYGSHGALLNLCKVDGKIPFNSSSVVLFIELSKLLLSVIMFFPEAMNGSLILPSPKQYLMFSVPAILYGVNNNIVVHIQSYVDPASFQTLALAYIYGGVNASWTRQVLSNLKIVCTAVLYRILLNRSISKNKWFAFIMITVAGAFNSYGGWIVSHNISRESEKTIHVTFHGVILILIYCCISATSGVYTEYILKKQANLSLTIQSIMLYSFGVGVNFCAFFMSQVFSLQDYQDFQGINELFKGFSTWTVIIIFTQAINGIIIAAIMKYASNLTRLILIAGAMLVSTILSVIIFSLQFNIYFTVAFVLIVIGMFIYHN